MDNWQLILFVPFIIIVISNFRVLILQLLNKDNPSYSPFVGLWLFFIGTLGLDDGYNKWVWLFVLLDIGTVIILMTLPSLIIELFLNSRFCRYRVYQNEMQRLTLYQFKHYQRFDWKYIAKTNSEHTPVLVGFGGDWLMENEHLYLNCGDDNVAIAKINHQEIIFIQIIEYYEFLNHQILKMNI